MIGGHYSNGGAEREDRNPMPLEVEYRSLEQPQRLSTSAEMHAFSLSSLVGCSATIGDVYGCLMVFLIGTFLFPLRSALCGFVTSTTRRSFGRDIIWAQLPGDAPAIYARCIRDTPRPIRLRGAPQKVNRP
jgi:hypothetical protein